MNTITELKHIYLSFAGQRLISSSVLLNYWQERNSWHPLKSFIETQWLETKEVLPVASLSCRAPLCCSTWERSQSSLLPWSILPRGKYFHKKESSDISFLGVMSIWQKIRTVVYFSISRQTQCWFFYSSLKVFILLLVSPHHYGDDFEHFHEKSLLLSFLIWNLVLKKLWVFCPASRVLHGQQVELAITNIGAVGTWRLAKLHLHHFRQYNFVVIIFTMLG